MAAPTISDLRLELERSHGALISRLDVLETLLEVTREDSLPALDEKIKDLRGDIANELKRVEKRLDEALARRWEVWKILLAAFVGSLLTLGLTWLNKSIDRTVPREPAAATAPARTDNPPIPQKKTDE